MIWVADGGIDEDCDGSIEWHERAKDSVNALVLMEDDCVGDLFDGKILSVDSVPVPDVLITFNSGAMNQTTTTDDEGKYRIPTAVNPLLDWLVLPTKTGDEPEGVSTLDLVKIQKHLLGLEEFDSPYKLIAADANNNMDVSATDLLELRKLILRITETLPNNTSWRFVKADHVFTDPADPWPFPEFSDLDQLNFIGMKVGDVNGTVTAPPKHSTHERLDLVADDMPVEAGSLYHVPVYTREVVDLIGLQFTLEMSGAELNDIQAGSIDLNDGLWVRHKHRTTASWSKVYPVRSNPAEPLFTLVLRPHQDGFLRDILAVNSSLTRSEAYDRNEEVYDVILDYRIEAVEIHSGELTISPNPWNLEANITLPVDDTSEGTIHLFNSTGQLILVRSFNGANITIPNSDLTSAGVYFLQVHTGHRRFEGRMVYVR